MFMGTLVLLCALLATAGAKIDDRFLISNLAVDFFSLNSHFHDLVIAAFLNSGVSFGTGSWHVFVAIFSDGI